MVNSNAPTILVSQITRNATAEEIAKKAPMNRDVRNYVHPMSSVAATDIVYHVTEFVISTQIVVMDEMNKTVVSIFI